MASNELSALGARRVFAFATHGLFSGPAAERIEGSSLEEVVVTNTIPVPAHVLELTRKVRKVSAALHTLRSPPEPPPPPCSPPHLPYISPTSPYITC